MIERCSYGQYIKNEIKKVRARYGIQTGSCAGRLIKQEHRHHQCECCHRYRREHENTNIYRFDKEKTEVDRILDKYGKS